MYLKHVFCKIDPEYCNLHGGTPPLGIWGRCRRTLSKDAPHRWGESLPCIRKRTPRRRCTMKLGMIGAGFVATFHAIALQQVRGVELTAVLKRRGAEALAHFARQQHLGPAQLYDPIADMATAVDMLAIYAPNDTRVAIMEEIVAAVKAGAALRGVICEKPLGRNVAEARRLINLAAEARLCTAYF